jgi:hypothetical protein
MNHGTQHLRNRRLGEAIVPNRRGSNLQDILTLGTMKTRNPKRPHLKTGVLATLRKFGPRDFYTREDWLRKGLVQIPASTDEVLIVPSMLDGWGFVVDFYDPAFCGMVSEGMFKAAIRTANTVVQSLHCTNRAKETRSYTPILNVLLLVAIASIVLGFISLQTSFYKAALTSSLATISASLFALVVLLSLGLFLAVFCILEDRRLSEPQIMAKLNASLDDMNTSVFTKLGYQWRAGREFYWLEFRKIHRISSFKPED